MGRQGLHSPEELYAAEGTGKLSLREALAKLLPRGEPPRPVRRVRAIARPAALPPGELPRVQVSGMHNLMVRFARCCSPRPGDPLRGIVTRGRGVSIHQRDCGNVARARAQAGRLVEAEWAGERKALMPVRLVVIAESARLAQVAGLMEEEGVPIQSAKITSDGGRYRLTVLVADHGQVERILYRLNAMAGIRAVRELESA
jgi:GTP pyrophosphokinase